MQFSAVEKSLHDWAFEMQEIRYAKDLQIHLYVIVC